MKTHPPITSEPEATVVTWLIQAMTRPPLPPPAIQSVYRALLTILQRGESLHTIIQRVLEPIPIVASSAQCLNSSPHQLRQQLHAIQQFRRISRYRMYPPGRRKLDPYRDVIITLRQAGASERDIQAWLHYHHRFQVAQSTVHEYLKQVMPHEQPSQRCE